MRQAEIGGLLRRVDPTAVERHVRYLAEDPLPRRTLNFTLPGHEQCTLYEADDYIASQLAGWGYQVEREAAQVQAFRRDRSKPKAHQYSPPSPDDPWYTAFNLYAKKTGTERPEQIIVVVSHKDSQSWVASPGANDNAIGTAANMELARVLAGVPTPCSIWFLFCNEEHTPWTSVTAAQAARQRGDNLIAIFNLDGLGRKTYADTKAGRMTNVTLYTTPEGERLADLMAEVNQRFSIGLDQTKYQRPRPGDDDGSFIKAGYSAAVACIGSYPYGDPCYHCECDVPANCDFENAALAARAVLAAMLTVCSG